MALRVRSGSRRALALSSSLVLAVGLGLVATAPAGAAPASSSSAQAGSAVVSKSVYATVTKTSSKRKKLRIQVNASKYGDRSSLHISLARGKESHGWTIPVPNRSVVLSNQGTGTIKLPATKSGGLGQLTLKVTAAGPMKASRCGGRVWSRSRNVKVAGKFFFDSKSAWGRVGSKTRGFSFTQTHRSTILYNTSCPPTTYVPPCAASLHWGTSVSANGRSTSISGQKVGSRSTVSASRYVALARPRGATRYDLTSAHVAAPSLTVRADDSARMVARGTRGSATIDASDPGYDYTQRCRNGSRRGTTTTTSWGGDLTNAGTALRVKAQVYGDFLVPSGSYGYFSRVRVE